MIQIRLNQIRIDNKSINNNTHKSNINNEIFKRYDTSGVKEQGQLLLNDVLIDITGYDFDNTTTVGGGGDNTYKENRKQNNNKGKKSAVNQNPFKDSTQASQIICPEEIKKSIMSNQQQI